MPHQKIAFDYINALMGGTTHIWGAVKLDEVNRCINIRDLMHYPAKQYTLLVHRNGVENPQTLVISHDKLWAKAK